VERGVHVVRFEHPLRKKTVRFPLGESARDAATALEWLNRVFMDPTHWHNAPANMPRALWKEWSGPSAVSTTDAAAKDAEGQGLPVDGDAVAALRLLLDDANREILRLQEELRRMEREAEHWKGAKIRTGPCPTLAEAFAAWKKTALAGKSERHRANVFGDVGRFVRQFGESVQVDDLRGAEARINAWLHSMPGRKGGGLAPSRRQQMRIAILKFLLDSGLRLDRKALPSAKAAEIRKARGAIHWLTKPEAEKLAKKLPQPYADAFRVQVGTGLRAEELLTLHRSNFSEHDGGHVLTLAPLGVLRLKNGPRTIKPLPDSVWRIVARRLKAGDVVFPNPRTKGAETDARNWDQRYARALHAARVEAKIATPVDCRTGRRTCASLLLRAKEPIENVAALLGDRVDMVREHYARILPSEVNPSAAALK